MTLDKKRGYVVGYDLDNGETHYHRMWQRKDFEVYTNIKNARGTARQLNERDRDAYPGRFGDILENKVTPWKVYKLKIKLAE